MMRGVRPRPTLTGETTAMLVNELLPYSSILIVVTMIVTIVALRVARGGRANGLTDPGSLPTGDALNRVEMKPGQAGIAMTPLRPAGRAAFGSVIAEVHLRHGSAAAGEKVRIVETGKMSITVDLSDH